MAHTHHTVVSQIVGGGRDGSTYKNQLLMAEHKWRTYDKHDDKHDQKLFLIFRRLKWSESNVFRS